MTQAPEIPTVLLAGGVPLPIVGFGTWQITGQHAYDAIRAALDIGYRHIDTATMYNNEREVGRAVRDSGLAREDIFITTKLAPARAGHERQTILASLQALDTDHVDLWLIHWPPNRSASPQTWRQFLAARDDGLARTVGVSNYSTNQLDELIKLTGEAPAVNQVPWSPSQHDAQTIEEHRERGVVIEGYSSLKSSDLRHPVLTAIAAKHGVTPAQVVLRWHLEHNIVVIPKSVDPARMAANLDLFGFTLTGEEVASIDGLSGQR
jgi:2,5-diketo-D-gluconate reductase A